MKKLLVCLLAALLLFSCISCREIDQPDEPVTDSDPVTPEPLPPVTDDPEPEPEPSFDYDGYLSLNQQEAGKTRPLMLGFKNCKTALTFPVPTSYTSRVQDDILILEKDGKQVGEIVSGIPVRDKDTRSMKHEKGSLYLIDYTYDLLAIPTETDPERTFRHSITFMCDAWEDTVGSITILLNYTAISDKDLKKCINKTFIEQKYEDKVVGILLEDGENVPRDILILGNSFISSSEIGTFLNTMFTSTGYRVTALSRGYACLCYSSWDDYIPALRNGNYDVVFLCGFYHAEDTPALQKFVNACEASDTTLVIFPAHNEERVNGALDAYPDLPVLHWKSEINKLMGVLELNFRDFCIDDAHNHSTPLAGYVGAHMIYRALTGEMPPEQNYQSLPYSVITEKLMEYPQTGIAQKIPSSDVHDFE